MDIRNPVQFNNFMVGHGLRDINTVVSSLCKCVDEYNKLCGNFPSVAETIRKKLNEGTNLYVLAVQQTFPQHTKVVMSKAIVESSITFYKEGKHIKTITR
jgi:hypothetical protein